MMNRSLFNNTHNGLGTRLGLDASCLNLNSGDAAGADTTTIGAAGITTTATATAPPLVTPLEKPNQESDTQQPKQLFASAPTSTIAVETPPSCAQVPPATPMMSETLTRPLEVTSTAMSPSALTSKAMADVDVDVRPIDVPVRVDTPFRVESQTLHSPSRWYSKSNQNRNIFSQISPSGLGSELGRSSMTMKMQTPQYKGGCKHKQDNDPENDAMDDNRMNDQRAPVDHLPLSPRRPHPPTPTSQTSEIPYISVAGRRKRRRTTFEDAFRQCLSMNDDDDDDAQHRHRHSLSLADSMEDINCSTHTHTGTGSEEFESFVMTPVRDRREQRGTVSMNMSMTPMSNKRFHNISKRLDYNSLGNGNMNGNGFTTAAGQDHHGIYRVSGNSGILQTPTPDRYSYKSSSFSFDMDGNDENDDGNSSVSATATLKDVDEDDSISSISDNEFAVNMSMSMVDNLNGTSHSNSSTHAGIFMNQQGSSGSCSSSSASASISASSSSSVPGSSSSSRILYAPRKHKKQMQYLDPVDERIEDLIRHSRIKAMMDAHRDRHRGASTTHIGNVNGAMAENGNCSGDNRHAERQRQRQTAYERYKAQNAEEREADNGRDGYDAYNQNGTSGMTTQLRRKNAPSHARNGKYHYNGNGDGSKMNRRGGSNSAAETRPLFRDDSGTELRRRGGDMNRFGGATTNKSRSNSVPRAMKYSDSIDVDMSE